MRCDLRVLHCDRHLVNHGHRANPQHCMLGLFDDLRQHRLSAQMNEMMSCFELLVPHLEDEENN